MNRCCSRLVALPLFGLILLGCSFPTVVETSTRESRVSKDDAVAVFSVKWYEDYLDLDTRKVVRVSSDQLDASADYVESKSIVAGDNELIGPLYYLYDQNFDFEGRDHRFFVRKYERSLRDYRNLGIYQVKPDEYRLERLRQTELKVKVDFEEQDTDLWHASRVRYSLPPKSWKLEAGKIYYLGHLELYFETTKFRFGFFPPRIVNERIRLSRAVWSDRFQETSEELRRDFPWFPSDRIVNVAAEGDMAFEGNAWKPYVEADASREREKEVKEGNLFW